MRRFQNYPGFTDQERQSFLQFIDCGFVDACDYTILTPVTILRTRKGGHLSSSLVKAWNLTNLSSWMSISYTGRVWRHTKAENPHFNSVLDIDSGNIEKHNSKFLWIIFLFLSLRINIEKTGKGYYTGRVWRALQKIYRVYWKAQFKIFMNYIFIFVPKIYQRSNLESDVYSVRRFQNYPGFTNQARKLWRACQP